MATSRRPDPARWPRDERGKMIPLAKLKEMGKRPAWVQVESGSRGGKAVATKSTNTKKTTNSKRRSTREDRRELLFISGSAPPAVGQGGFSPAVSSTLANADQVFFGPSAPTTPAVDWFAPGEPITPQPQPPGTVWAGAPAPQPQPAPQPAPQPEPGNGGFMGWDRLFETFGTPVEAPPAQQAPGTTWEGWLASTAGHPMRVWMDDPDPRVTPPMPPYRPPYVPSLIPWPPSDSEWRNFTRDYANTHRWTRPNSAAKADRPALRMSPGRIDRARDEQGQDFMPAWPEGVPSNEASWAAYWANAAQMRLLPTTVPPGQPGGPPLQRVIAQTMTPEEGEEFALALIDRVPAHIAAAVDDPLELPGVVLAHADNIQWPADVLIDATRYQLSFGGDS